MEGRGWGFRGMTVAWRCLVRMDGRGWVMGCGYRHDLFFKFFTSFGIIEVAVHVIGDN